MAHSIIDKHAPLKQSSGTATGPVWLKKPQHHDYPAATSFLSLNARPKKVRRAVKKLKSVDVITFKAKDLLRATGLPLLPRDDADVAKELARIESGQPLSPCLVVRGKIAKGYLAQIADGYHRVCASYHVDEDADIPVHIADF